MLHFPLLETLHFLYWNMALTIAENAVFLVAVNSLFSTNRKCCIFSQCNCWNDICKWCWIQSLIMFTNFRLRNVYICCCVCYNFNKLWSTVTDLLFCIRLNLKTDRRFAHVRWTLTAEDECWPQRINFDPGVKHVYTVNLHWMKCKCMSHSPSLLGTNFCHQFNDFATLDVIKSVKLAADKWQMEHCLMGYVEDGYQLDLSWMKLVSLNHGIVIRCDMYQQME